MNKPDKNPEEMLEVERTTEPQVPLSHVAGLLERCAENTAAKTAANFEGITAHLTEQTQARTKEVELLEGTVAQLTQERST